MPYEPKAIRFARSLSIGALIVGLLVAAGVAVGSFGG